MHPLFGQDPGYSMIDKSMGLPSNSVYDLLEDSRGFIWMATDVGLCRYDGFTFKLYTNSHQTSRAGSEIMEDRFGRIWYENFDGYLFYVENDSLKSLQTMNATGYAPYGLGQNTVFVCEQGAVNLYDLATLTLKKKIPSVTSQLIFSQSAGNFFYVNFSKRLVRIDEQGNQVDIESTYPTFPSLGKIINNGSREIWLYNRSEGLCIAPEGNDYVSLFEKPGYFLQSASCSRGLVWFCTTTGAFAYDSIHHPYDNGRIFFRDKSISSVICDRENNYWFSTTNEGVIFVSNIHSRVYFPELKVRKLVMTDSTLLAGTINNSIFKLYPEKNQEVLHFQGQNRHTIDLLEKGDDIFPLVFVSDSLYVQHTGRIKTHPGAIKDVEIIAPGIMAFAASGICGIYYHEDAPDSPWKSFAWELPQTPGEGIVNSHMMISNVRGKSICYDSLLNAIYFATNTGLYKATPEGIEELRNEGEVIYAVKLCFFNGVIYALTNSDSIITIHRNEKITPFNCESLTRVQGMRCEQHYLFVYNSDEIVCYNLLQSKQPPFRIKTYANEIYDLTLYDNQLLIACNTGMLSLNFYSDEGNTMQPLFHLNDILVNGNRISGTTASDLSLTFEQNNLSIEYSILSFKNGLAFPLYYKINDGNWELCPQNSRVLNFSSLAPGNYRIEFSFRDSHRVLDVSQVISFTIDAPWWYTWWAITAYVLVFISGLWLVYHYQIRKQERKMQLINERIALESKLNKSVLSSIKSQMNPHFFYNALNTIQSYIYANDKQNAGTYLSKFSKLTRMILEMSDKEVISLQEEITACRLYLELEQARFENDFEFDIQIAEHTDPDQIRIPSMLIQPYIENAVKHGLLHKKGLKKLSVIFEKTEQDMLITIADNGIGRKRSAELNELRKDKHRSFSSDANEKRLELLNRGRKNPLGVSYTDNQDENGLSTGTTVHIHIPLPDEKV